MPVRGGLRGNADGGVGMIDVDTGKTTLFMPHLPAEYAVWMGDIPSVRWDRWVPRGVDAVQLEDTRVYYDVDAVEYEHDLEKVFLEKSPSIVYVLKVGVTWLAGGMTRGQGKNTDSGKVHQPPELPGGGRFIADTEVLYPALVECRLVKVFVLGKGWEGAANSY